MQHLHTHLYIKPQLHQFIHYLPTWHPPNHLHTQPFTHPSICLPTTYPSSHPATNYLSSHACTHLIIYTLAHHISTQPQTHTPTTYLYNPSIHPLFTKSSLPGTVYGLMLNECGTPAYWRLLCSTLEEAVHTKLEIWANIIELIQSYPEDKNLMVSRDSHDINMSRPNYVFAYRQGTMAEN